MKPKTIICFGAHADDIELGMAGTVLKLTNKKNKVIFFISRECNKSRYKEQLLSDKLLNVPILITEKFKYQDDFKEIGCIDSIIKNIKPNIVYFPSIYDSNQHHRKLAEYVMAALRRTDISCYMYEPTTIRFVSLEKFNPQIYEDISSTFELKMKAISMHKTQLRRYGEDYLEYVKNKDAHNGYQIGTKYAEVFQIVREIR